MPTTLAGLGLYSTGMLVAADVLGVGSHRLSKTMHFSAFIKMPWVIRRLIKSEVLSPLHNIAFKHLLQVAEFASFGVKYSQTFECFALGILKVHFHPCRWKTDVTIAFWSGYYRLRQQRCHYGTEYWYPSLVLWFVGRSCYGTRLFCYEGCRASSQSSAVKTVHGGSGSCLSWCYEPWPAMWWMGGSDVSKIFSAVLTMLCRDFQWEALQAPNQTEIQLVSMLSIVPLL